MPQRVGFFHEKAFMHNLLGHRLVPRSLGLTRREFLRVGSLAAGALGLSLNDLQAANAGAGGVNCILLFLVGGPSQLDTWDLKPGTQRYPRPFPANSHQCARY